MKKLSSPSLAVGLVIILIGLTVLAILTSKTEVRPIEHAVIADFNNDGEKDGVYLQTRQKSGYWYVIVVLDHGKSFQKSKKVLKIFKDPNPRGGEIVGIRCKDVDEDGNLDLIIKEVETGRMLWSWTIFGNGDGTFQGKRGVKVID